jgi:PAS domain S-box-containing protein
LYGQNKSLVAQIRAIRDFLKRHYTKVLIAVLLLFISILLLDYFFAGKNYSYLYYTVPIIIMSLYANCRWSVMLAIAAGILTLTIPFLTPPSGSSFYADIQSRSFAVLFFLLIGLGISLFLIFLKEIVRYETLITTIINNIPYGVFFCDSQDRIIHLNPSVTRLTGYSEEEIAGKDGSFIENNLLEAAQSDSSSSIQLGDKAKERNLIRKNGTTLPVAVNKSIITENNHSAGAIYVIRDITKEKELETAREEMLSILYHDLRTPLSVISSYAGFMQEKDFDDSDLPKITNSIDLLCQTSIGMLENLLEDARQKSGKAKMFPAKYNLEEIINSIIKMYFNYANEKGIIIESEVEKNVCVYGDLVKIRQIIFNLMSNAIKFANSSGRINIKAIKQENFIKISFTDNGPGIPEDFIPNIFKRFTRADGRQKGSGLGLYITKKLVEMQGGTIQVRSGQNQGTTFEFFLPSA